MLSPLGGLWRWLPKSSRFDFSIGRRCWSCASDRMQPRLGGALHSCEHVQPCVHTNTHKRVFFKVLPLQSWQGFGAFWKRRAVVFLLPLCLYVPPSLMISISFSFIFCGLCLLLLIILFPLESTITLSFCTRVFHSSCLGLSGPFLSSPCHGLFSSMLWGWGGGQKAVLCSRCLRGYAAGVVHHTPG